MFIQLISDFTVNGASATPGLCYFCRSTKRDGDEGVISTGVHVDTEGLIEVCQPCWAEGASTFGMRTAEQTKNLRENNRQQGLDIKKLEKRIADLEHFATLARSIQEAPAE